MLHIVTRPNRYGDTLESVTLRVTGLKRTRWGKGSVHVVPEGREARQVFQGPLVPGPWPYTVTHATVIDNHGGSAAEFAVELPAYTPLTVDGLPGTWQLVDRDQRRLEGDGFKLVPVDA